MKISDDTTIVASMIDIGERDLPDPLPIMSPFLPNENILITGTERLGILGIYNALRKCVANHHSTIY